MLCTPPQSGETIPLSYDLSTFNFIKSLWGGGETVGICLSNPGYCKSDKCRGTILYHTHYTTGDEKSVFIEREFLTILFHKLRKLKLFYMVNTIPGDEKSVLKGNF